MPFKSEAQRRYLHAKEPEVAEKFEAHTSKGQKLPEKKSRGHLSRLTLKDRARARAAALEENER